MGVPAPDPGNELIMDCRAGTRPLYVDEACFIMGGSWFGCGCKVLTLENEVWESCPPDAAEEMECDLGSVTDCGMNESHWTCGNEMAPEGYVTEGSMSAAPLGE